MIYPIQPKKKKNDIEVCETLASIKTFKKKKTLLSIKLINFYLGHNNQLIDPWRYKSSLALHQVMCSA